MSLSVAPSAGFNLQSFERNFEQQLQQLVVQALRINFNDGFDAPKAPAATHATARAASTVALPKGPRYHARGTGYYPANNPLEGGTRDRLGKPLHTLQDYLKGKAPYVSVAMDPKAFKYGQKLRIPELEKKYHRKIQFRVVDTGGAFFGKGKSRIDICTKNNRASLDPTINGRLTLIPYR